PEGTLDSYTRQANADAMRLLAAVSRVVIPAVPSGDSSYTRSLLSGELMALRYRNRRLAKDFEATLDSALAWLFLASVKLLMRRLGRIPQPKIVI
ncbi:MAG: hypothetical protein ACREEZ_15660, partial [Stellaceae bacterium]